jgi:hypothetical protein
MLPDEKIRCPATGFAKTCKAIVTKHTCPKWVHLIGKDPQTGAEQNAWGCVDSFLPKLLLENAQQARQAGAAIESFRNEVVRERQMDNAVRDEVLRTLTGNAPLRLA